MLGIKRRRRERIEREINQVMDQYRALAAGNWDAGDPDLIAHLDDGGRYERLKIEAKRRLESDK